jgi:hypothetical protein
MMNQRCSTRLGRPYALALYLTWVLAGSTVGFAHGPAESHAVVSANNVDGDVRDRLEAYYRLFSDLCYLCPTRCQRETLQAAEAIFQLLHVPQSVAPDKSDIDRFLGNAVQHYARLVSDYPVARLRWDGQSLIDSEVPRVSLARGVVGYMLVELRNETAAPVDAGVRPRENAAAATVVLRVPATETRTWIVPLQETHSETTRIEYELVAAATQATLGRFEVPVSVVEPARILGTLVDEEFGRTWPGRVIVECSDHLLRHGEAFANNATLSEKPVIFRPAMQKLPFFYCDGHFAIDVPPGPTTLTIERGYETTPVTQTLELKPGEQRSVEFRMRRFTDLHKLGWTSGDTHIHWVKNSWDQNEELDLLSMVQRAEDLRVANNLTLYQWRSPEQGGPFIKPDHFPPGPVQARSDGEYHLQMAEEYRNDNHYGHINLLGISELIRPLATGPGSGGPPEAIDYPLNRTAILEARRQGGISIEAHNLGPVFCSDVPVNVALGLADSLDQLDPQFYYQFLNCGFHIGLTNGSDHPARVAGAVRAYVRLDGPFTYPRWLEGVRRGRTFVTSGPLVMLTVNGVDIGDTLQATKDTPLRVRARAVSRYPVGTLQLVSNGEVLQSVTTEEREATIEFDIVAEKSRWFTARVSHTDQYDCLTGPDIAHTSAVYVVVDGREVIRREAVEFWMQNVRQHSERIRTVAQFANDEQRQEALQHVAEGLAKYESLLTRAKE